MLSSLTSSEEGSNPGFVKTKTFNIQYLGVRATTGQPRVIIMFLGKVTWLPADCCLNVSQHIKIKAQDFGKEQSRVHS